MDKFQFKIEKLEERIAPSVVISKALLLGSVVHGSSVPNSSGAMSSATGTCACTCPCEVTHGLLPVDIGAQVSHQDLAAAVVSPIAQLQATINLALK